MIDRIIAWSLANRLVVTLLFAFLAVLGVHGLVRTPIDAIPDLSENQVIVFSDWPGRGPQEIEDQVTYPLSVSLQGLAGVKTLRSSSEFGFSMIELIFRDDVAEGVARSRVLDRLATLRSSLPSGVAATLGPDANALGQIFWYTLEGGGRDLGELRALQDWYVRYQLQSVEGVAAVASVGGMPREWQVDVEPERLVSYGVTLGEVYAAIARSNAAGGGSVLHKGNAEYVVRGLGALAGRDDLENTVVRARSGVPIRVKDVAVVQLGSEVRRSVLEKDGREAVGGVVMMRQGENPLEVTKAVRAKIDALTSGLPPGVRVVPFYDRTRLVTDAIRTVGWTVVQEIVVASLVIFLVMLHLGASIVLCIALPLAVLGAFGGMHALGIPSNIMSLSGIAISIGVLVDQAIVLTDNGMHRLRERFGDRPVTGDVRALLTASSQEVGRPVFFAILIMIVSFAPVFALTGIEGKMFRPLAWTKTLALISVGLLTITLLPAILPTVLRGRMRKEEDSWLVRSVIDVYRPVLDWLMDRRRLVVGAFAVILATGWILAGRLGSEFMPPLDEGSILDMPVTTPRASITQVADDLRARNAILRSFPEVELVVGKAGRADTPLDPSPLDMIETVITLKPHDLWPHRNLEERDARRRVSAVMAALEARGILSNTAGASRDDLASAATRSALERFDEHLRGLARARQLESRTDGLRWELEDAAPAVFQAAAVDATIAAARGRGLLKHEPEAKDLADARMKPPPDGKPYLRRKTKAQLLDELDAALHVPGWANIWTQPIINRIEMLATGVRTMVGVKVLGQDLDKVQHASEDVARAVRMVPGAADVFPDRSIGKGTIEVAIDRARAARYGINAADVMDVIEVAVGGRPITQMIAGRERYPVRLRYARSARLDEESIRRILVAAPASMAGGDESARAKPPHAPPTEGMPGMPATPGLSTDVAPAAAWSDGAGSVPQALQIPLGQIASVRVVEGPAIIKGENGLLRNYVQLNVRGRDVVGFVHEAQRVVAQQVKLPEGVHIEWTGQFEHQVHARRTLSVVFPVVFALIFLILYVTYRDVAHASLVMMAVPGALAGGVIFQKLFGFNFSVAVWVGYIACFGMATETGIVMLVYLRQAIGKAGGLKNIESEAQLRSLVLDGAVRRLRPKLLTEATCILGLAPMLWATGVGAEVMRPMAAPVLGGILIADEVIDLFVPVLFFAIERRRWRKRAVRGRIDPALNELPIEISHA